MARDEIDSLKEGGMFIKNWAIAETPGNNIAKSSKVFVWLERYDEKLLQQSGRKHTDALCITRDRIYDAIKESRSNNVNS